MLVSTSLDEADGIGGLLVVLVEVWFVDDGKATCSPLGELEKAWRADILVNAEEVPR